MEKGSWPLSGKVAQQVSFINDTRIRAILKWLYNFVSERA